MYPVTSDFLDRRPWVSNSFYWEHCGRLRQENHNFVARLGYIVRWCLKKESEFRHSEIFRTCVAQALLIYQNISITLPKATLIFEMKYLSPKLNNYDQLFSSAFHFRPISFKSLKKHSGDQREIFLFKNDNFLGSLRPPKRHYNYMLSHNNVGRPLSYTCSSSSAEKWGCWT
jgi:hypothetical protein